MESWKNWILDSNNRPFVLSGLVILFFVLPIALILVNRTQNYRSSAAAADKLEAESGTLGGNAQSFSDQTASGGKYIAFVNTTQTPIPPVSCPTNLQTAITNALAGSILDVTGCGPYSGTYNISKSITLKGSKINAPAGNSGIIISADNVTVVNAVITGAQALVFNGNEKCIYVQGTSSNTVENVIIKDSTINRCGHSGIWATFSKNASIQNNSISDSVYSGILLASVSNSTVSNNTIIRTGVYGGSANGWNAYGITATNLLSQTPSSDIIIQGNTIDTVPTWHGLDTHGGIRISFLNNIIRGARRGIFITTSNVEPVDSETDKNDITAPTSSQISSCLAVSDGRPANYCTDIRGISINNGSGTITNNIGHNYPPSSWWNPISGASGYTFSGNNPSIP